MFKKILVAGITAASLLSLSPAAEASVGYVQGVFCVNHDLNMPIIDGGSGVVSFLDVSSSYVYSETDDVLIIKVNKGYYDRHGRFEWAEDNPFTIKEYKKSGKVNTDTFRYKKWMNDAYYLVKQHALSNR